ncbi:TPA_exp: Conserved glutamic acid rich protein [Trichophyton benhamiae CBS 112371]|uniref:Conserved glutamic acid rich protein n=1 Tax=Arthroderma benhamiae (strain ATCC MYA-4681 / CBS 112371) TaxID=663331 RepID=D4AX26_ARTBC|nr:conserved glutamic acid rich protein [Trichophyton benhamiae CBS 112371]EFE32231.1 conserved glutamic acid rich protein [Trichophyton benhamiae CBS 112371]DAA75334.1 TPA_exp: Conserved glutamic acid rich protein [Trichophyton benhamiae CBS 112371]
MAIKTRFHEDYPRGRDEILDIRHRRGGFSPPSDGIRGEWHTRRRRRGRDEEYEEEFEIEVDRDRRTGHRRSPRHYSCPREPRRPPPRVVEREDLVVRREESPGWKRREKNDLIARREKDIDIHFEGSVHPVLPRHRPSHVYEEDIFEHQRYGRDTEDSGTRRHKKNEDERALEVDVDIHEELDDRHYRGRKHDPLVLRPRELVPAHIREEDEYYSRHVAERPLNEERYRDTSQDWCIMDVPSGTRRAVADGLGGVSEEMSWRKDNGVRRSRHLSDKYDREVHGTVAKRYVGVKEKCEELWTEITKDLVVKEAIEEAGYDYEETADFFYVFSYLEYDDVAELVKFTEDYRRRRRDRVLEIQNERSKAHHLPPPFPQSRMLLEKESPGLACDDRRVEETEIFIDESRRSRRRSPILRERVI